MLWRIALLAVLSSTTAALAGSPDLSEAAQVRQEACGADPQVKCLAELKKICHEAPTFRCYYSRKGRLDAIREVGFPDRGPRGFDE